jgi:hypothetical protein
MRLTPVLVLAVGILLIVLSVVFDHAARAANRPATQPATQPAKSLSQVIDELSPTDEQRAKIIDAVQTGGNDWRSWWRDNHLQVEDFADQAREAAQQKDSDKVKAIEAKGIALARTMPKSADTWKQITALFLQTSPSQLDSMNTDAKRAISRELHAAIKGEVSKAGKTGMAACTGCHMPDQRI